MSLTYDQIADAALLTQQRLIKRGAFVGLQTDLTRFIALEHMWKKRKKAFDGGDPWEFECQVDHNHSAEAVGLYQEDSSSVGDTMIKGVEHPRYINAHYIYDLREKAFQRGGVAIVDYVKSKYIAMMMSVYEYLEHVLWNKPEDSTDTLTPFGIPYWVTKSSSTPTGGFTGSDPDGFTGGRAGINTADQARWANWSANYTSVSKTDLIRLMRSAARNINFVSPLSFSEPKLGSPNNGIYTNGTVVGLMEEVLEENNMNLGNDIAPKDGRTMFKGSPIVYAPKLDDDTSNPVYMLDWEWLAIGVQPGWENRLSKPYMVPKMHNVRRVDWDATLNMVCTNLRRQAVIYVA
jgi:hypothetical protein